MGLSITYKKNLPPASALQKTRGKYIVLNCNSLLVFFLITNNELFVLC
jgi:hypothetical protein